MTQLLPLDTVASMVQALLEKALASREKAGQFFTSAQSYMDDVRPRVEAGEAGEDCDFGRWCYSHIPAIVDMTTADRQKLIGEQKASGALAKSKGGRGKKGGLRQAGRNLGVSVSTIQRDFGTKQTVAATVSDPAPAIQSSVSKRVETILALLAECTPAELDYIRDWLNS